jgi:hypothetical protein
MDGDYYFWLPDSPLRTPHWRHDRANWLSHRRSRFDGRIDDPGVRRVKRFLVARDRHSPAACDKNDPALARALQLFTDDLPHMRSRLEAYLLTSEPLEIVAERCALPLETITTYEHIFFNVRKHLAARGWIMTRVIGGSLEGDPGGVGAIWKYFGYAEGPLALEFAIAATTDQPLPEWVRALFTQDPEYQEADWMMLLIAALTARSPAELSRLGEIRAHLNGPEARTSDRMLPAQRRFLRMLATAKEKRTKRARATRKTKVPEVVKTERIPPADLARSG